ncbi:MAG: DUF547 domain-containing protein [Xanthomonadales bacterium]|jgi:hypothetical protein|nr:DUF547 domain-containing protein [Xanthomonadales bacterium]
MLLLASFALLASGLAQAFDHQHAALTTLLTRHVEWNAEGTATAVDYAGMRRDRAVLGTYLTTLSAVTPAEHGRWSKDEQLAFLINAYNGWTLALIADADPEPASIRDLGGWFRSPWKQRFFTLLGESRSLDDVEHGLIRGAPDFAEPRIHFAVNCASIGCPALRPEAYRAADLEAQLEDQTRRFLRDRTRNRYDVATRTLRVTRLFDWYGSDFDLPFRGSRTRSGFLLHYAEELALDAEARRALGEGTLAIGFLEYDWRLNRRVASTGR